MSNETQTKLMQEINKINREIYGLIFNKKQQIKCNVMNCKNKPIHKLYLKKFKRTLWCCKKHRVNYGEDFKEE